MRRKHPEREDARYFELRAMGKTIEMIALLRGVSTRTVRKGIKAAKDRMKLAAEKAEAEAAAKAPPKKPIPRDPAWVREMIPLFPIEALSTESTCSHRGPIRAGSMFVCMICHQSGMDRHPALRRELVVEATQPTPPAESRAKESSRPSTWVDPNAKPKTAPPSGPTRKERRQPTAA